jgi:SPP1 family predicted phage head-tail adaptor
VEPYIDTARHYSEQFMPDVVVIQKPGTQEPDGRGGFTTTPGETITTKGRLAGLTADEEVQASKLSSTSTAKVSVPFAMSVTSADGLTVAGVEYNVQGVLPRSAARSANKNVLVAESG